MAKWFKLFKRRPKERFSNWAAILTRGLVNGGIARDYASQAREAFEKNVIAYRAISSIAQAVANIPYVLRVNGKEAEQHPLAKLIKRPSPRQAYKDFLRTLTMHRLIGGNAYVLGVELNSGKIAELNLLRPDRVRIETNLEETPIAYRHSIGGRQETYPIDPISLESQVLHLKEPNPLDDLYGMSPIQAAAMGIKQHNESSRWNQKLLENLAKPPGILAIREKGAGAIGPSTEELEKLRKDFNKNYAGPENAGKVPFFPFDVEFRQMGMSPKDMDWIQGKNTTARDIALAFGYSPYLLGLAEGSTFNNVKEAKLSFYEETVVPLTETTQEEISYFLSQKTGQEIEIVPDLDQVDALAPIREAQRKESREDFNAGIITLNEARAIRQYDELPNGDDVLVPAGKLPLSYDPEESGEEEKVIEEND